MAEFSDEQVFGPDEQSDAQVFGQSPLDPQHRDLAIRTVWGEAANEPEEGQAAVAAVIRNRTAAGRFGGNSVPDVVFHPNAFEPWQRPDRRDAMLSLRDDSPEYQRIGGLVDDVFANRVQDPTEGSTHFFAPAAQQALGRSAPSWAQGEGRLIGNHAFFAPEGRVQPGLSDEQVFAPEQKPLSDVDVGIQPASKEGGPNALSRGFVSGLLKQNPEMAGEAMEGLSHLAPDMLRDPLVAVSKDLLDASKLSPQDYATRAGSMWDVKSIDEGLTWAGETVGQGVASTVPSVVLGTLGGVVGGRVGGKVGAVGGALGGAAVSSGVQNYGEVYKALKDEKVDPKLAAEYALYATGPMVALDTLSIGPLISRLGGLDFAKRETARFVARRIAEEAAKGAGREGVTEAAQEAVKWATVSLASDKPFWTVETAKQVVEAGVGGALTGGAMGGAGGIIPDRGGRAVLGPDPTTDLQSLRLPQASGGGVVATRPTEPMFATRPDSPVFVSKLREAAETKLPESSSAEQMIATLRNTPGVKGEEIEATGLDNFLAGMQGQRISKGDVIAHLEENQVQVREVVRRDVKFRDDPAQNVLPTQYEDYTLQGPRSGYRELLLTLPEARTKKGAEEWIPHPTGGMVRRGDIEAQNQYQSPHWTEPNVLAHVRFTDRVDTSGTPVLFLEEVQSDWHQTGRKQGYADVSKQEAGRLSERYQELRRGLISRFGQETYDQFLLGRVENEEITHVHAEMQGLLSEMEAARGVPNAPFKTSWPELTLKRMIRWAADNGYSRIAWTSGDQQVERYTGGEGGLSRDQQQGMREFYDRILPSIARRWAKRLGGVLGETRVETARKDYEIEGYPDRALAPQFRIREINSNRLVEAGFSSYTEAEERAAVLQSEAVSSAERVQYIEIPPRAMSAVQQGLPLFATKPGASVVQGVTPEFRAQATAVANGLAETIKHFNIRAAINIQVVDTIPERPSTLGYVQPHSRDGSYTIVLNVGAHTNITSLQSTAMHEFGHVVMYEKFYKLETGEKQAIRAAYERFRLESSPQQTMSRLEQRRGTAPINTYGEWLKGDYTRLYELSPEQRDYFLGFNEWFAEQVARWGTSSERALGVAERALRNLGVALRNVLQYLSAKWGMNFQAAPVMQQWLDSFIQSQPPLSVVLQQMDQETQAANQQALDRVDPGIQAVPLQMENSVTREGMKRFLPKDGGPEIAEMAAHADRMSWVYKWSWGLGRLIDLNPHVEPLVRYGERIRQIHLDETAVHSAAYKVAKSARHLGKNLDNVFKLIDDVTNMRYRSEEERAKGIARHPTKEEFNSLVRTHKVNAEGVEWFRRVRKMFDIALDLSEQNAIEGAVRIITDPIRLAQRQDEIRAATARLRTRPYFPFMRFGRHWVKVVDQSGAQVYFTTVERKGLVPATTIQRREVERLEGVKKPGHTVTSGVLPETATPFLGVPPTLLESIQENLDLTPDQSDALQQLRLSLAPEQSFLHQFQHKNYVPGYSADFLRSFSRYFLHFGRYYARTKHSWALHQEVLAARKRPGNDAGRIANYMADHLKNTVLDAKSDFGIVKAGIFQWMFAYFPAGAVLNLTQLPLITFPYLAAKYGGAGFGNVRATKALTKAMSDVSTYYKKERYDKATDFEMRAFNYGIKTGRITEAQAHELAASSEGQNLLGFGDNKVQRAVNVLIEKGPFMFEMTEQTNRRITYRAALDLAQKYPDSKGVREAIAKHPEELRQLEAKEGFTPAEARAVIAAAHATSQTQYEYTRYERPRIMRGRALGTVLVFQQFMLNTLQLLWANKSSVLPQYLLMMMLLGGLKGIPGADDLDDMIKFVSRKLFGKDFSVEKGVRQFIKQFTNNEIPADIVLHGLARRGFGVPALIDMLGGALRGNTGRGLQPGPGQNLPFPSVDMSKSVGMGRVLPFELDKVLDPGKDVSKAAADTAQRASGAAFGMAFNLFKFFHDRDLEMSDPKRWERVLPRELASLSKAGRYYVEERERSRKGPGAANTILRFDPRDTEQMMEILSVAGGFQPTRLTAQWDLIRAEKDAKEFWVDRRQGLFKQYEEALAGGIPKEKENVIEAIKKFNGEVRDTSARTYAITSEQIRQSMMARARARMATEAGVSVQKRDIPLMQEIQGLYPEATIDVRRVR